MTAALTATERWRRTVNFEPVDRPVRFETIGYWKETFARWHREGLPGSIAVEASAVLYFQMDLMAPVGVGDHENPGFWPPMELGVVEETERYRIIRTPAGGTWKEFKDGSSSRPEFLTFAVKNLDDFQKLKARLSPEDEGRYKIWEPFIQMSPGLKVPLYVLCCGLFGFARHLLGFERLMESYFDQPELIHAFGEQWVKLCAGALERVAKRAPIHGVWFWEDMAYRNGSLISPKTFREFMTPYYQKVTKRARELNAFLLMVDTDGWVGQLIPLFLEAGVNFLLPFEVQADNDILAYRQQYGKQLGIFGGIDKRALFKSREEIEAELESKVPAMLASGGYVPSLDHVVPPEVSLENFRYFLKRVREIGEKSGKA
jgi:uroporphyrinogen decarboxylase